MKKKLRNCLGILTIFALLGQDVVAGNVISGNVCGTLEQLAPETKSDVIKRDVIKRQEARRRSFMTGIVQRIAEAFINRIFDVHLHGLDEILAKGDTGILFFSEHVGLIDPLILMSAIGRRLKPRPVAHEDSNKSPISKYFTDLVDTIYVPNMNERRREGIKLVHQMVDDINSGTEQGDNILLYPSGIIKRQATEKLASKGAMKRILDKNPNARIVEIKWDGLWGSSFTWGHTGNAPYSNDFLTDSKIKSFIMGNRKRRVDITFTEPANFPRHGSKREMNAYFEGQMNKKLSENIFVPYDDTEKLQVLPDPMDLTNLSDTGKAAALKELQLLPAEVQEIVFSTVREMSQEANISSKTMFESLGLDSLGMVEIISMIEAKLDKLSLLKKPIADVEFLNSVADLLKAAELATAGQPASADAYVRADVRWFREKVAAPSNVKASLNERFIDLARSMPDAVVLVDGTNEVLTYRDILRRAYALVRTAKKLPGKRIGVIESNSSNNLITQIAIELAGKSPEFIEVNHDQRADRSAQASAFKKMNDLGLRAIITNLPVDDLTISQALSAGIQLANLNSPADKKTKTLAYIKSRFRSIWLANVNIPAKMPQTFGILDTDRVLTTLSNGKNGMSIQEASLITGASQIILEKDVSFEKLLAFIGAYRPTALALTPDEIAALLNTHSRNTALQSIRKLIIQGEPSPNLERWIKLKAPQILAIDFI